MLKKSEQQDRQRMNAGARRATNRFHFHTRLILLELTGRRARNLKELLEGIREVPESVIYHHTHHFLQQHLYLSPEPPNDFSYWVREALDEDVLSERLSSIDTCEFNDIESLRAAIVEVIEAHLKNGEDLRQSPPGEEFNFMKAVTFILPTRYQATTLQEFADAIQKVTVNSLYFHIFEARLRLGRTGNDFSRWLEDSLGEVGIAQKIARLDPYTHTLEGLRKKIRSYLEDRPKT
ncbi:MAG: DUF5752 family protein [Bacteroidota bacterium]